MLKTTKISIFLFYGLKLQKWFFLLFEFSSFFTGNDLGQSDSSITFIFSKHEKVSVFYRITEETQLVYLALLR